MKLSIITINYNNGPGLKDTVKSVAEQTFRDFEYILIDGASTDSSLSVIDEYKDQFSYWISEKDTGIYNAMNKGWKKATGEYCLFLNSGDYLLHDKILEEVVPYLTGELDMIYGDMMFKYPTFMKRAVYEEEMSVYNMSYTSTPHQGTFVKYALIEKLGGFDEEFRIISDWLFLLRAFMETDLKIKKIPLVISVFDMTGVSNTINFDKERSKAIDKYYPFLKGIFNDFAELRYYRLSGAHQKLKKFLGLKGKIFSKGK